MGEHLSVEYLFFHAVERMPGKTSVAGTTMAATAAALAEEGQPAEQAWPYSTMQSAPWTQPTITSALHKMSMHSSATGFDDVVAALGQGHLVILGLVITDAFYRPDAEGRIVDQASDTERTGHAVVAVGHGADTGGQPALLVRNSWGDGWGSAGYGWLSRSYVTRQICETALLI